MEYIELAPGYKIRVDYFLMDDINMYMVFDLQCEEEQDEYNRMSIVDLVIKDEQGNIIHNRKNLKENTIAKLRGWKSIEGNSNKNIRELKYMISNGYPNIETIDISFSKITLYNDKNTKIDSTEINGKEVNISIDIDEKFINQNIIEYEQEGMDNEYIIEKAIITDTGFYSIIKTTKINYRLLNVKYTREKIYYHQLFANIKKDKAQKELILKSEDKGIRLNKK